MLLQSSAVVNHNLTWLDPHIWLHTISTGYWRFRANRGFVDPDGDVTDQWVVLSGCLLSMGAGSAITVNARHHHHPVRAHAHAYGLFRTPLVTLNKHQILHNRTYARPGICVATGGSICPWDGLPERMGREGGGRGIRGGIPCPCPCPLCFLAGCRTMTMWVTLGQREEQKRTVSYPATHKHPNSRSLVVGAPNLAQRPIPLKPFSPKYAVPPLPTWWLSTNQHRMRRRGIEGWREIWSSKVQRYSACGKGRPCRALHTFRRYVSAVEQRRGVHEAYASTAAVAIIVGLLHLRGQTYPLDSTDSEAGYARSTNNGTRMKSITIGGLDVAFDGTGGDGWIWVGVVPNDISVQSLLRLCGPKAHNVTYGLIAGHDELLSLPWHESLRCFELSLTFSIASE
ncbi:hypothetical protein JB92DRAFT_2826596 [Gautieria morchelliformis]|nr:hypothetical protein JB92DRAFT_2826596 [Gautieria morchelliformis]